MKTCKSCVYWVAPTSKDNYNADDLCNPKDSDTHEPMKRGFEVRLCKMPTQTLFEAPVEDNGFALTDGSKYFCVLATAENFGCVRHLGSI